MKHLKFILISVLLIGFVAAPASAKKKEHPVQMIPASFSQLASEAKPGVVNIQTVKTVEGPGRVYRHFFGNPYGDEKDPFHDFWGPFFNQRPQSRTQESLGSGFIISKKGYIVTNNHVIKGADKIRVILHDNTKYDATLVGTDPLTDIAVIKIKARNLVPLKFGKSEQLQVGSWVVAIGSPFGLEQTVTAGIVSAKGRIIGSGPYDDFIQTDASINPGNSGGPLLNLDGEVVGINTAIIKSGQGIGFAIPSDLAAGIIDQLVENKKVSRGWMGVAIQNISEEMAEYYNIPDTKGVFVEKVFPGNPAAEAGIMPKDIITKVNSRRIEDVSDLTASLAAMPVGSVVKVTVIRDGKLKNLEVKLGSHPGPNAGFEEKVENKVDTLGLDLRTITPDISRQLGYRRAINGLLVMDVDPGGLGAKAGLRQGDIILEIDRHTIENVEQYHSYLKKIDKGDRFRLLVKKSNGRMYVFTFSKP